MLELAPKVRVFIHSLVERIGVKPDLDRRLPL